MGPATYAGLVRSVTRQAREGRMLPWLVFYEEESNRSKPRLAGQLTVSGNTFQLNERIYLDVFRDPAHMAVLASRRRPPATCWRSVPVRER